MDFLDPKKQRAHRVKLFIGYGLMAVALGIATTILFLRSSRYYLDPRTGEVTQGGLVFVDADPEPAQILLNGEDKGLTDKRLDVLAGNYELELKRDGYRSWKRSFTLEGKSVERFLYPVLFPEKLETSEVQLYSKRPAFVTQSPDRRWLIAQQPGSFTSFEVLDLNSETLTSRVLTLPGDLLRSDGDSHTLKLVEWSSDNIHVLLKHTFEGGSEFFVLNTESAGASQNITDLFDEPFTAATLRDKRFNQFYLYNKADQTVRRAATNAPSTAPTVLADVIAFRPHGNDVMVYVTAANAPEGKVLMRVLEGDDSFTVRELPADSKYLVDIARFENAWYIVAASSTEKKAFVYRNPVAAVKRLGNIPPVPVGALRLDKTPEFLSFSANARFISFQGGNQFAVYDNETDRQYRYDSQLALQKGQKAYWMDGYRLTLVSKGKTVIFDYDGTNKQKLAPAVTGTQPLFDGNYEILLNTAISKAAKNRFAITRTELVVTP